MSHLSLRKLQLSDVDLIEQSFQSASGASEYQWFGYWNTEPLRERVLKDQFLGLQDGSLAVALDEKTIGRVEWFPVTAWGRANTSWCWEIAIGIFEPYRGRGYGLEAQRLLVDYLFEHYPQDRIQATTALNDKPEQACLAKLGFTLEGHIRHAQWRQGKWHDQLLYSLLRDEQTPVDRLRG